MSQAPLAVGRVGARHDEPVLRVCLDANVWLAFLIARAQGRETTAAFGLVNHVLAMRSGRMPIQLIVSHELLDTLGRVLRDQGFDQAEVAAFVGSLVDLMKAGPERRDPTILLSGRDQLAMHDREDAGILATCLAARAHLLVTDNLRDFEMNDGERIDTRRVTYRTGGTRQLYAILNERADGVALAVMHPFDAIAWLAQGSRPTPKAVREHYSSRADR